MVDQIGNSMFKSLITQRTDVSKIGGNTNGADFNGKNSYESTNIDSTDVVDRSGDTNEPSALDKTQTIMSSLGDLVSTLATAMKGLSSSSASSASAPAGPASLTALTSAISIFEATPNEGNEAALNLAITSATVDRGIVSGEVTKLTEEKGKLNNMLQKTVADETVGKEYIGQLAGQLVATQASIGSENEKIQLKKESLDSIKENKSEIEQNTKDLQLSQDQTIQLIDSSEESLTKLYADKQGKEQQQAVLRAQYTAADSNITTLTATLGEKTKALSELKDTDAEGNKVDNSAQRKQLEEEIATLQKTIQEQNKLKQQVSQKIEIDGQTVAQLNAQIGESRAKLVGLNNQKTTLTDDIKKLVDEGTLLEAKEDGTKAEMSEINAEIAELVKSEAGIEKLKGKYSQEEAKLNAKEFSKEIKAQIKEVDTQIDAKNKTIDAYDDALKAADRAIKEQEQDDMKVQCGQIGYKGNAKGITDIKKLGDDKFEITTADGKQIVDARGKEIKAA